jgi:amino acid adenylation domain-containing protein
VTVFMVLLGAFQVLLHRYTGQAQLLVGTPVAGRQHEDLEGLIGFFVNTLVMKADFTDGPSFQTHLGRVRAAALEAYAHQDVPFEKLVEVLGVTRDPSRSPLFQVMFSMVEKGGNSPTLGGLAMVPVEAERHSAKFDLGLFMAAGEGGLVASLEYNADLFEAETAARMLGHLGVLLADAVARPETPVARLALLTEAEQQQMVEWNRTETAYPETTLPALFEAQVERTPEAVAVVFEGESLTYRALDERANQLAHTLQSLGVGPDVLVGICVERSLEMVVGLLGVLKAGGAYVPLDPSYPAERLAFMLEDARVPVLLTQERLAGSLSMCSAHVMCLDGAGQAWKDSPRLRPVSGAAAESLAYVLFTSGSTGRPKGVEIPHRALTNFVHSMHRRPGMTARDTLVAVTSLSFDIAGLELYVPLCVGGRVALASREVASDGLRLAAYLERAGATVLQATPATWQMLLSTGWAGREGLTMLCGGEALPVSLAEQLLGKGGPLWNMFGPTETTIWSAIYEVLTAGSKIPIGRAIANTHLYVLDGELSVVPIGVAGELYIGGDGLARGYLNRPALTREKFVADPFSAAPGARLYRTGDLCRYLPDGNIEFLGRLDHQVKLRGFRIELGEIEAVLGQCAGVQQCIVVVREDRPGDKVLVAYMVGEAAVGELRAVLGQRLPEYMVPSAFVRLEALPLTPNGKVDRKALPAPGERPGDEHTFVPPRTQIEALLVEIWEYLLQTRPIGVHDDFFHLGGHSLLAVRLMAAILDRTGRQLPLASLFSARTVAGLAAELSIIRAVGANASPLVALRRTGSRRPFFCVHPVGGGVLCYEPLARLMGPEQPFYALQALGVERDEGAQQTVEAMAERYLAAVRAVQPEGPYQLGGWSFGGLIAFEMARQLTAAGEEVAALVLLDSRVPRAAPTGDAMAGFEAQMAAELGLTLTEEELAPLGPVAALARVVEVAEEAGTLPRGRGAALVHGIRATRQAATVAASRYAARSWNGSLTLLRAQDTEGLLPEEDFGWGRLCATPIAVRAVPGTHGSMVRTPHVEEVARVLMRVLDAAGGGLATRPECAPSSSPRVRPELEPRWVGQRKVRGRAV